MCTLALTFLRRLSSASQVRVGSVCCSAVVNMSGGVYPGGTSAAASRTWRPLKSLSSGTNLGVWGGGGGGVTARLVCGTCKLDANRAGRRRQAAACLHPSTARSSDVQALP
jgi:hypothetical protein